MLIEPVPEQSFVSIAGDVASRPHYRCTLAAPGTCAIVDGWTRACAANSACVTPSNAAIDSGFAPVRIQPARHLYKLSPPALEFVKAIGGHQLSG